MLCELTWKLNSRVLFFSSSSPTEENSGKYLLVAKLQMVICHSNLLVKIFSMLSRQAGPILFLVCRNSFSLKMFPNSHVCGFWFSNSSVSFHRTISSPPLALVWDGARAGHTKPSKGNQPITGSVPLVPAIDSEMITYL